MQRTDHFLLVFVLVVSAGKSAMESISVPSAAVESRIKLSLVDNEMWRKFASLPNEMIVTKKGRHMYPRLKVQLFGLHPQQLYAVRLDIVPVDQSHYTYKDKQWYKVEAQPKASKKFCTFFSMTPSTGEELMKRLICFKDVKLTNSDTNLSEEKIHLPSHRLYQAQIEVVPVTNDPSRTFDWTNGALFVLPDTRFIAVTVYKNQAVIDMKVDNNPYACPYRVGGGKAVEKRRFEEYFPTPCTFPQDQLYQGTHEQPESKRFKSCTYQDNAQTSYQPSDRNSSSCDRLSHPPIDLQCSSQAAYGGNFPQTSRNYLLSDDRFLSNNSTVDVREAFSTNGFNYTTCRTVDENTSENQGNYSYCSGLSYPPMDLQTSSQAAYNDVFTQILQNSLVRDPWPSTNCQTVDVGEAFSTVNSLTSDEKSSENHQHSVNEERSDSPFCFKIGNVYYRDLDLIPFDAPVTEPTTSSRHNADPQIDNKYPSASELKDTEEYICNSFINHDLSLSLTDIQQLL